MSHWRWHRRLTSSTALGVVAPQIRAEFHLDTLGYQTIINAFLLAFTLSYALGRALMDRIGAGLSHVLTAWSLVAMAHGFARTPGQMSLFVRSWNARQTFKRPYSKPFAHVKDFLRL